MSRRMMFAIGLAVGVVLTFPLAVYASHQFPDVPDNFWAHDDIAWAADNGIFDGYPDGTFGTGDPVLREEAAAVLRRMALAQVVDAGTVGGLTAAELSGSPDPTIWVLRRRDSVPEVDDTISSTPELLTTIGEFTKFLGDTHVKVTFNSHATLLPAAATGLLVSYDFCDFQVRIDGVADKPTGSTGRIVLYEPIRESTDRVQSPASVSTVFSNISAGSHNIEIWVRGQADSCGLNQGGFYMSAVVEEVSGTLIQN